MNPARYDNYAYYKIQLYGDGQTKTLTYDLPKGMPIPHPGDLVEVVFDAITTPVKYRIWSVRDRVEIRLQGIWAMPAEDMITSGWTVVDHMDADDVSSDMHSAGWKSFE